jgi:hypothetical protein
VAPDEIAGAVIRIERLRESRRCDTRDEGGDDKRLHDKSPFVVLTANHFADCLLLALAITQEQLIRTMLGPGAFMCEAPHSAESFSIFFADARAAPAGMAWRVLLHA